MAELYQTLAEQDRDHRITVLRVLEEPYLGEKALLCEEKLLCCSDPKGLLQRNEGKFSETEACGVIELEGKAVFCEPVGQEKTLAICGGGHVSAAVVRLGKMIGFHTVVFEDRPKFADNARQAGADEVYCEAFETGLDRIEGSVDTYFVIATRGHRYDHVCLRKIAEKNYAYVGMIGSRRRVTMLKRTLAEEGVDQKVLTELHAPIGLAIDAETPAEIAVSIMAEIISVKNGKNHAGEYSRELMHALLDENTEHGRKMLATIVRRKGSAPREVGTKMLIYEDGTTVGTIGGGCAEAEIFSQARSLLMSGVDRARICHVDMTTESAEDEGMVCGGRVDILLEVV
ncbi:MAG: XdhC family protein [Lachnospiraceae bacterium]|nr:XdhC family protein [Lachnospiraceae bacterium]MCD8248716.1 XdhC family protein [Lachnospiraceae bacterium]